MPLHPHHDLREGSRLTLTCDVSEGDPPLSFEWKKNGGELDSEVTVNNIGDFTSWLRIDIIQIKHAGNYTCSVRNAAAHSQLTTSVLVNGESSNYKGSQCYFFFFQFLLG